MHAQIRERERGGEREREREARKREIKASTSITALDSPGGVVAVRPPSESIKTQMRRLARHAFCSAPLTLGHPMRAGMRPWLLIILHSSTEERVRSKPRLHLFVHRKWMEQLSQSETNTSLAVGFQKICPLSGK